VKCAAAAAAGVGLHVDTAASVSSYLYWWIIVRSEDHVMPITHRRPHGTFMHTGNDVITSVMFLVMTCVQGQGQGQEILKANTKDNQKPLPQISPLHDRTALTL